MTSLLDRRAFLGQTASGLGGIALAQLLAAEGLLADDKTPILFLTARGAEDDILEGFALGADDYVVKPFSPRELVARCRAIIARNSGGAEPKAKRLQLDRDAMTVRFDAQELAVTAHEFRLLAHLSSTR